MDTGFVQVGCWIRRRRYNMKLYASEVYQQGVLLQLLTLGNTQRLYFGSNFLGPLRCSVMVLLDQVHFGENLTKATPLRQEGVE
jgi:hypothetical protein